MRPLWKGSLSFGLVNIPIRIYSATSERELKFVMLHKKDNSRIHYARICEQEGIEVPWKEIVKGYEYQKGDFVILDEEDFDMVNRTREDTIEIDAFINDKEIDSIYFEKPYFIEPDKASGKAYALLRDALNKSKKVGLVKFVLHHRTHLGIIRPFENLLILNQLRYQSEIATSKHIDVAEKSRTSAAELAVAIKLIAHLTKTFKPANYKDTYVQQLKALIEKKKKGVKTTKVAGKAKPSTKVHDIMAQLKASLKTPKTITKPTLVKKRKRVG